VEASGSSGMTPTPETTRAHKLGVYSARIAMMGSIRNARRAGK
jgi:hypothetical protein